MKLFKIKCIYMVLHTNLPPFIVCHIQGQGQCIPRVNETVGVFCLINVSDYGYDIILWL